MKKILPLLLLLTVQYIAAQETSGQRQSGLLPPNLVSAGPVIALGDFASTHSTGITIEYSRSRYIFGKNKMERPVLITYALTGGMNYFFGKKVTVSNYPYKYKANTWLYALGGVMVLPAPAVDISLTAGPALMLYHGNSEFAFSSKLQLNYFVAERIAVSPSIQLLKAGGTNALWAAGIKGSFSF